MQKITKEEVRQLAESDLVTFAKLVNPQRVYGEIHETLYKWLQRSQSTNQLMLLPRGHMKSHMIAVWCAWEITRDPATTILYVSATATLAEAQLADIKSILDSEVYRRYWPDMTHPEEGKRKRWNSTEIIVDHQMRVIERTRDATVKAVGLGATTTGLHADIVVADDVVVPENAYTEEGRRKTAASMSQMASIKNAGGRTKAVGTRYHPSDIYNTWKNQKKKVYDDSGEFIGEEHTWEIYEAVVEIDGTFLWPKEIRNDGKAFGFDLNVLAGIEAEYEDRTQFFAQYYNDPNDPGSQRIGRDKFQYYDKKFLEQRGGDWYFKDKKLNLSAAIDFAFSINKKADWTSIVVVGVDSDRNYYLLDIDRFKTDKISQYYEHLFKLYSRWEFRKLRAEVTVAQAVIVRDLRDNYIKPNGLMLSVQEERPTKNKEERIAAVLETRYENQQVWHFRGGYTAELEDELVQARPQHDDIKDALAAAIESAMPPARRGGGSKVKSKIVYHSRFGGVN